MSSPGSPSSKKGIKKAQDNLYDAFQRHDIREINIWLKLPLDLNYPYGLNKTSVLHMVVERNDLKLARILLEKPKVNVNLTTLHGETPLIIACRYGWQEMVDILLRKGKADANIALPNGQTPLHIVVLNRDLNLLKKLIHHGANVNAMDCFSNTPLSMTLTTVPNYSLSKYLINRGASITGLLQPTVLHCNSYQHIDLVDLLLESGADINEPHPPSDFTALHIVAITNYTPLAIYLVEHEANLYAVDKTNRTPTDIATIHKNYQVLNVFNTYLNN